MKLAAAALNDRFHSSPLLRSYPLRTTFPGAPQLRALVGDGPVKDLRQPPARCFALAELDGPRRVLKHSHTLQRTMTDPTGPSQQHPLPGAIGSRFMCDFCVLANFVPRDFLGSTSCAKANPPLTLQLTSTWRSTKRNVFNIVNVSLMRPQYQPFVEQPPCCDVFRSTKQVITWDIHAIRQTIRTPLSVKALIRGPAVLICSKSPL